MPAEAVLIVEDDTVLRQTMAEILVDEGYHVRSAPDGHAALQTMRGWEPDVVILDLMMPTMDAYEFRQAQRALGAADGAAVLIVSARPDVATAAERLGADGWLAKPFTLAALVHAIRRVIEPRYGAPTDAPPNGPGQSSS